MMNKRILVFLTIALMLISTASAGFFSELFNGELGELIVGESAEPIEVITGETFSDITGDVVFSAGNPTGSTKVIHSVVGGHNQNRMILTAEKIGNVIHYDDYSRGGVVWTKIVNTKREWDILSDKGGNIFIKNFNRYNYDTIHNLVKDKSMIINELTGLNGVQFLNENNVPSQVLKAYEIKENFVKNTLAYVKFRVPSAAYSAFVCTGDARSSCYKVTPLTKPYKSIDQGKWIINTGSWVPSFAKYIVFLGTGEGATAGIFEQGNNRLVPSNQEIKLYVEGLGDGTKTRDARIKLGSVEGTELDYGRKVGFKGAGESTWAAYYDRGTNNKKAGFDEEECEFLIKDQRRSSGNNPIYHLVPAKEFQVVKYKDTTGSLFKEDNEDLRRTLALWEITDTSLFRDGDSGNLERVFVDLPENTEKVYICFGADRGSCNEISGEFNGWKLKTSGWADKGIHIFKEDTKKHQYFKYLVVLGSKVTTSDVFGTIICENDEECMNDELCSESLEMCVTLDDNKCKYKEIKILGQEYYSLPDDSSVEKTEIFCGRGEPGCTLLGPSNDEMVFANTFSLKLIDSTHLGVDYADECEQPECTTDPECADSEFGLWCDTDAGLCSCRDNTECLTGYECDTIDKVCIVESGPGPTGDVVPDTITIAPASGLAGYYAIDIFNAAAENIGSFVVDDAELGGTPNSITIAPASGLAGYYAIDVFDAGDNNMASFVVSESDLGGA